ncbi:Uncharacterised protein [Burkholderia pseudomallei]|nr:Uncharacterised protein [Burkholderia pseudomallei]CAJ5536041.1 Uncharacterised protein [Burkholderia pseudomallei]CAJ7425116.1 Uncharacterised protein [Burkholderia pseudomallei]CAJ7820043.1 Uncharacterised protein [Burkholderia pseudomallei]
MSDSKPSDRLDRVAAEIDSPTWSGFEPWIEAARASDAEAARDLLAALVVQLRTLSFPTSPISVALARFTADAVAAYLNGAQPSLDKAFGLVKGRGAPTSASTAHREIAFQIWQMQRDGKSWNEVYEAASAQGWAVTDERELRRIYTKFKGHAVSEELSRRLAEND